MCLFHEYIDLSTAKLLLTERKPKLKCLFFLNYSLVSEPRNVKWNGREKLSVPVKSDNMVKANPLEVPIRTNEGGNYAISRSNTEASSFSEIEFS
jgi:hypothetical protein